jgi:hypothetical protein
MGTPLFSLVHCTARLTLGKPFYWVDAMAVWRERCDNPSRVEYLLGVDAKDARALYGVLGQWGSFKLAVNAGRPCAVNAWNTAAAASTGDIIITVADDYFPPEHWDTQIAEALNAVVTSWAEWKYAPRPIEYHLKTWEFVLDVDNQDNSHPLLPFTFISRAYYNRLGYLFWPEYYGIGADCDFTEVARRDGVVIDARHLKFEHRHWGRGLREMDEVDRHQQSAEAEEAHHRVLTRRRAEGFPPLKKP